MKQVWIMIGFGILAFLVLLVWLQKRPAVPSHYQQKAGAGGPLEAKYLASGPYETVFYEEKAMQDFKKYEIYYPAALRDADQRFPVLVLNNGTGVPLSRYSALARHFASWGFVVIGTEEAYAWDGFGAEMCVRHLEKLNESETIQERENIFYQKIDLDHMGIAGHSQGAVGVFNAITAQPHHACFKAAAALSPTNMELAAALEWNYKPGQVKIPILLISGAGGGDDAVVSGDQLKAIYDEICGDKVMMRCADTAHGEMLYKADGCVLAWFMWQLQGDEEAAEIFSGPQPEAARSAKYQDFAADFGKK